MTKYKRLTGKGEKINNVMELHEHQCECMQRLAELEDQIENGTLVQLPLPLGADCWCVVNAVSQKDAFVRKQKFTLWLYDDGRWGRIVFATRAEAEAKLEQHKKEQK